MDLEKVLYLAFLSATNWYLVKLHSSTE